MPAIRRKERSGPGIGVVPTEAGPPAAVLLACTAPGPAVGAVTPEPERAGRHIKAQSDIARTETRRQEAFIAHILRPSRRGVTRDLQIAECSDGMRLSGEPTRPARSSGARG